MSAEDDEEIAHMGSSPARFRDPLMAAEAKKALVWALVIGFVALCVLLARPLLVIFAGAVFAAMIDGGARVLGRYLKIGRTWRVTIVIFAGIIFLAWTVSYAGNTIAVEAAEFPSLIQEQANKLLDWARANGLAIEATNAESLANQLASGVGTVTRALTGILGGITSMIFIAILGIYFALEPRLYERGVAWMLPDNRRADFYETASRMGQQMRHLLAGRLFGMVVEGVFTWLMLAGYALFNDGVPVPMAVLLGLLTGLLAFIPNIGAVISGVLMVLVGFSGGVSMGLYTIFVYFSVQTIDGYVLIPLIARKTVDLAPALVLAAQLIMGILFGILGLALADPLVAMIKVALERRAEQNAVDKRFETDLALE
ncbi:MAG TPA: AI-2E family transporter [Sphingomonadaceae bacterium]|nr:AI-2E family transporter [Sphingomonadaceae bacterium]